MMVGSQAALDFARLSAGQSRLGQAQLPVEDPSQLPGRDAYSLNI